MILIPGGCPGLRPISGRIIAIPEATLASYPALEARLTAQFPHVKGPASFPGRGAEAR